MSLLSILKYSDVSSHIGSFMNHDDIKSLATTNKNVILNNSDNKLLHKITKYSNINHTDMYTILKNGKSLQNIMTYIKYLPSLTRLSYYLFNPYNENNSYTYVSLPTDTIKTGKLYISNLIVSEKDYIRDVYCDSRFELDRFKIRAPPRVVINKAIYKFRNIMKEIFEAPNIEEICVYEKCSIYYKFDGYRNPYKNISYQNDWFQNMYFSDNAEQMTTLSPNLQKYDIISNYSPAIDFSKINPKLKSLKLSELPLNDLSIDSIDKLGKFIRSSSIETLYININNCFEMNITRLFKYIYGNKSIKHLAIICDDVEYLERQPALIGKFLYDLTLKSTLYGFLNIPNLETLVITDFFASDFRMLNVLLQAREINVQPKCVIDYNYEYYDDMITYLEFMSSHSQFHIPLAFDHTDAMFDIKFFESHIDYSILSKMKFYDCVSLENTANYDYLILELYQLYNNNINVRLEVDDFTIISTDSIRDIHQVMPYDRVQLIAHINSCYEWL